MESFNAKFGTWKNRPFKSFIIFTGNRQFENELNDICDEIYKRYESKDFTPQSKKVKESAIKQWSDTNSIETIYMQALVGGGEVIHRVACKSVTRAGKTVIFDAFTLCNSDSSTSIYYLIEDDDLLKKYPACAKCKK